MTYMLGCPHFSQHAQANMGVYLKSTQSSSSLSSSVIILSTASKENAPLMSVWFWPPHCSNINPMQEAASNEQRITLH